MPVRFNICNNRINVDLSFASNRGKSARFIVDTGAMITTMSVKSLSLLLGFEEEIISSFISNNATYKSYDISGKEMAVAPVMLRSILLGRLEVDQFIVFVTNNDIKVNVLGMDFITAGVSTIAEDEYLEFVYWSNMKYLDRWKNLLKDIEPFEVNAIQGTSRISDLLKRAEG